MSDALAAWAPALTVYLRRSAIVGALTIVLMVLFGWVIGRTTGFWQVMYVGPVLALAYNIGFEDPAASPLLISSMSARNLAGV